MRTRIAGALPTHRDGNAILIQIALLSAIDTNAGFALRHTVPACVRCPEPHRPLGSKGTEP
jgi:hypothetical protein